MNLNEHTQELSNHFSKLTQNELVGLFGPEKGDALHRLYERQFKIHYNNYGHMMTNPLARRLGINSLFLMALDDVLMEIKASYSQLREAALSIYNTMLIDFFESEMARIKQEANPWRAFVDWVKEGNKANYENDYFKLKEIENSEEKFGFDIHRCFYFEILKESGRPELGPILCEYDSLLARLVEDWIRFTRHETIASGDSHCSFRYERMH